MNTHKVKRHRNSDTREPQLNYRLGTVSNELLGEASSSFTGTTSPSVSEVVQNI